MIDEREWRSSMSPMGMRSFCCSLDGIGQNAFAIAAYGEQQPSTLARLTACRSRSALPESHRALRRVPSTESRGGKEVVSSAERGRLAALRPAYGELNDGGIFTTSDSLRSWTASHSAIVDRLHRLPPLVTSRRYLDPDSTASTHLVHHANGRGSEFESMNKSDCASCHRANAAEINAPCVTIITLVMSELGLDRRAVPTNDPQIADRWRESLQRR